MIENIFLLTIGTIGIIMLTLLVPFLVIWQGAEHKYSKEFFVDVWRELVDIYKEYYEFVMCILFGR